MATANCTVALYRQHHARHVKDFLDLELIADDPPGTFLPSPAEIAATCSEIQATWSRRERMIRAGMVPQANRKLPTWLPPVVREGGGDHV